MGPGAGLHGWRGGRGSKTCRDRRTRYFLEMRSSPQILRSLSFLAGPPARRFMSQPHQHVYGLCVPFLRLFVIARTSSNWNCLEFPSTSPIWPALVTGCGRSGLNSICLYINNQQKLQGLYGLFLSSSGPSLVYIPKRLSEYFTDNMKVDFPGARDDLSQIYGV